MIVLQGDGEVTSDDEEKARWRDNNKENESSFNVDSGLLKKDVIAHHMNDIKQVGTNEGIDDDHINVPCLYQ